MPGRFVMTTCHDSYAFAEPVFSRVVVGVDGSPGSLAALRRAAVEARTRGARLRVVHAYHPHLSTYPYGAAAHYGVPTFRVDRPEPPPDESRDGARRLLRRWVAESLPGPANPPAGIDLIPAAGRPWQVLTEAAAGADLLVIGAGEHSGRHHFVFGSTAAGCALHAQCPVLIVPAGDRRGGAAALDAGRAVTNAS